MSQHILHPMRAGRLGRPAPSQTMTRKEEQQNEPNLRLRDFSLLRDARLDVSIAGGADFCAL